MSRGRKTADGRQRADRPCGEPKKAPRAAEQAQVVTDLARIAENVCQGNKAKPALQYLGVANFCTRLPSGLVRGFELVVLDGKLSGVLH